MYNLLINYCRIAFNCIAPKNDEPANNWLAKEEKRLEAFNKFCNIVNEPGASLDEILALTRSFSKDPEVAPLYDPYITKWLEECDYPQGARAFGYVLFNDSPHDAIYFLEVFDEGQDAAEWARTNDKPDEIIGARIKHAERRKLLRDGREDLLNHVHFKQKPS